MIDSILIALAAAAAQLQAAHDEAMRDGRKDLAAAIEAAQWKLNACYVQVAKPRQVVA